jgi:hypothetical protein
MEPIINNKGQSTIEFLLTFTVAVGFIFLFLKLAMNYTNGFMVHHATYMASRAYLVNDAERQSDQDNDSAAETYAIKVFKYYMPSELAPEVNNGETKAIHPSGGSFPLFTGIVTRYTTNFSLGFIGGKEPLRLTSESFLGREPTRTESTQQTCRAIMDSFGLGSCSIHTTLDDNGG